jgi:hypothetical protein
LRPNGIQSSLSLALRHIAILKFLAKKEVCMLLKRQENPIRDWFKTIAASIVVAGSIGIFTSLDKAILTYALEFFGFFALVFGLTSIFQPKKEPLQMFGGCIVTPIILLLGQHYGLF